MDLNIGLLHWVTLNCFKMLLGILVLIITGFTSFYIIRRMKVKYQFLDEKFLRRLYFFHVVLTLAYYGYVLFNPSDSWYYYEKVVTNLRGNNWFDFYGTSTAAIEFIGYPFIHFFGFSYEGVMAVFSFFGFLGFIYFYIFFRENIHFRHKVFGYDLFTLIFFLPNLHFWSSSFGKGAVIFLGIGLFFYGISNVPKRFISIIAAGLIIYHVRPHVMLVILVSSAIGFIFSTKGLSISVRVLVLVGCTVAFFLIYKDVLSLVGIDEEQVASQPFDLTHRARELTKATSGVDITSYSLPMQIFTFLYRPLFVDAPGMLGIIVSFENLFYLLLTLKLFHSLSGFRFLFTGTFLTKTAFLSFVTVTIALAQIAGNLGLAMRQKSQVMILLMFVILSFKDSMILEQWKGQRIRKSSQERRNKLALKDMPKAT